MKDLLKSAFKSSVKTAWWMARLTVAVSLVVTLLQYFGILKYIAAFTAPMFNLIGLPGEAALVFISGYFVNIYSAVAAAATMELTAREMSIIGVMCLCAHNMLIEVKVQQKTGSNFLRMLGVRTIGALVIGLFLNWVLPENATLIVHDELVKNADLQQVLINWVQNAGLMVAKMFGLIIGLNVLQKLLSHYGVLNMISGKLKYLMLFFGLAPGTAFLWIVANTLGLAYGAAIMIEESKTGEIGKKDIDLLNHHIGVSHSNLEDLLLFFAAGASIPVMLFSRWLLSLVAVWERRLEFYLKDE